MKYVASRSYGTGTGSIVPVRVLADHTLLAAAAAVIPECALTAFTLQCGHGKRGYVLDVLNGKPTDGARYLLQVVPKVAEAGDAATGFDKVVVNFAGSCGHGKPDCPAIRINGGSLIAVGQSPHTFDAPFRKTSDSKIRNIIDFVRRFVLPEEPFSEPQRYTIRTSDCSSQKREAVVEAYAPFKVKLEGSLGYQKDIDTDPVLVNTEKKRYAKAKKVDPARLWNVNAEYAYTHGTANTQYKIDKLDDSIPQLARAVGFVARGIDEIISPSGRSRPKTPAKSYKFDVQWPKLAVGAEAELTETDGDYDLGFAKKFYVKMDPLIGADLTIDVVDVLTKIIGGGFSLFVNKVRQKLAEGVSLGKMAHANVDVVLDLIINGTMALEAAWEKKPKGRWAVTKGGKPSGEVSSERTVSLSVQLEGKIEARIESEYLEIKVTVGVEVALKGAHGSAEGIGGAMRLFATLSEGQPAMGGEFIFTGMVVTYAIYKRVGKMDVANQDTGAQGCEDEASKGAIADNETDPSAKLEEKRSYTILEPKTWPDYSKGDTKDGKEKKVSFNKLDI